MVVAEGIPRCVLCLRRTLVLNAAHAFLDHDVVFEGKQSASDVALVLGESVLRSKLASLLEIDCMVLKRFERFVLKPTF